MWQTRNDSLADAESWAGKRGLLRRYREAGEEGLVDRSSAPLVVANRTEECRVEAIAALAAADDRRGDRRVSGHGAVNRFGVLTRIGMGRLGRISLEPAQRYERARPGELVHIAMQQNDQSGSPVTWGELVLAERYQAAATE